MSLTDVAAAADVPSAPPWLRVEVAGLDLLLLHVDGQVRAVARSCPHLGGEMTSGPVERGTLACPRHFYAYDLADGRNTFPGDDADVALPTYDVVVRDGRVLVDTASGQHRGGDTS